MKHLLIVMLMLPTWVAAHSKMSETTPANGAILTAAPETVQFTFDKGMRLVLVVIDGAPATLPEQDDFAKSITVTAPPLSKGRHQVEWRGLSSDGHPVNGTFAFTVQ
jgi:methionine-rich copper-binding protein CopC